MSYKFGKSSKTIREQRARDQVLQKRMRAEGHKTELLALAYGAKPETDEGKLLNAGFRATYQRDHIRHTSSGDFSHLHANRMIIK